GTGYYYPAYVGTYWYPYPPTYGYGAGFTVGFFWGFAMAGYRPCCYGGGGVYVSHHTNINIDNSYNRWGNRAQAGQLPANRAQRKRALPAATAAVAMAAVASAVAVAVAVVAGAADGAKDE